LGVFLQTSHKIVILSEALRRSIVNRGLHSAESKDPGDACWQMLLGAFRPQTTPEDKKSQTLSEAPYRFIAWYSAGRGVEGPRGALILFMPLAPFQPPKPAPCGAATVQRFGTNLGMEGLQCMKRCTRDHQERTAGRIQFSGLGSRKAPNSIDKISSLEVPSATLRTGSSTPRHPAVYHAINL
jgi:hypothetical protein